MNNKELYKLLQTVKKNIRCPQCGKEYDFTDIRIRGIMDMIVFLELSCTDHMPVLATVTVSRGQLTKNKKKNTIGANDIIETYEVLKDFSGGFDKIFLNKNK